MELKTHLYLQHGKQVLQILCSTFTLGLIQLCLLCLLWPESRNAWQVYTVILNPVKFIWRNILSIRNVHLISEVYTNSNCSLENEGWHLIRRVHNISDSKLWLWKLAAGNKSGCLTGNTLYNTATRQNWDELLQLVQDLLNMQTSYAVAMGSVNYAGESAEPISIHIAGNPANTKMYVAWFYVRISEIKLKYR